MMWEVEIDGRRYEVEAPDVQSALIAAQDFVNGSTPFSDRLAMQEAQPLSHGDWADANPDLLDRFSIDFPDMVPAGGVRPSVEARQQYDPEGYAAYEDWAATNTELLQSEGIPNLAIGDQLSRAEMAGMTFANAAGLGLVDDFLQVIGNEDAANEWRTARDILAETTPGFTTALEFGGSMIPAALGGAAAAKAGSTFGRVLAGTGIGAAEGELAGIGYSDPNLSFSERAMGAIPYAVGGGIMGGAFPAGRGTAAAAANIGEATARSVANLTGRTTPEVQFEQAVSRLTQSPADAYKAVARSIYDDLEGSGLYISPNSFDNAMERTGLMVRYGNFDSVNRIVAEINRMREAGAPSFSDLDRLRQVITNEMRSSTNANELDILGDWLDGISEYVDLLDDKDLITMASGANLSLDQARQMLDDARTNWRIGSKLAILEEAAFRAGNSAGDQATALQTQIRNIVNNPVRRRSFTAEEIEMMTRIANGDKSLVGQFVQMLGWMAPRGWANLIPMTASIMTSNLAPFIPTALGAAARRYGNAQTQQQFEYLMQSIAGRPAPLTVGGFDQAGMTGLLAPTLMPGRDQMAQDAELLARMLEGR